MLTQCRKKHALQYLQSPAGDIAAGDFSIYVGPESQLKAMYQKYGLYFFYEHDLFVFVDTLESSAILVQKNYQRTTEEFEMRWIMFPVLAVGLVIAGLEYKAQLLEDQREEDIKIVQSGVLLDQRDVKLSLERLAQPPPIYCSAYRGCSIESTDFSELQLFGLYVPLVNLEDADLQKIEIEGVTAIRGDFTKANLSNASILGANFAEASFKEAVFDGTVIVNSSFEGALIEKEQLYAALLCGVEGIPGLNGNRDCDEVDAMYANTELIRLQDPSSVWPYAYV